ncbi:hypothetical protein [Mycobacterium sp.]|uniref:hypothetical protein n=1 Tax=Mycobacterium sp. TaxID=1785 RepID=UPI0031D40D14
MKLARPDIRHPRIALAGPGRDAGVVAALRNRGLHAHPVRWDDPDTLRCDLVILREITDYADRVGEFLAWSRRVPKLLNAPDVIAWNTDRRYLRDLDHAGVPTASRAGSTTALIFVGGRQSHAVAASTAIDADFELWDIGHRALQAAAQCVGIGADELLYARADVGDDARLAGLDLVAPSLGWRVLDDTAREAAQRLFAVAVQSALDRLGLGPLRRP